MKMITLNILKYFYANLTRVLEGKADVSKIGAINGIASLDANGKVPVAQIPTSGQGDKYRLIESESEGYAKVYKLQIKTSEASDYEDVPGATVNIPKDMVVESGSVKTCTEADTPVQGYEVGDKYIDLVIANKVDAHIYISVKDLIDNKAEGIQYSNTTSKLTATNVQGAIDEIVETKANKTEILPTYTLAEYEEIKDTIPVGTKFIITDDEDGDDPTPSGGGNAINSYNFKKAGDSYTIPVKDKIIYSTVNNKYVLATFIQTYNNGVYTGVGRIIKNDTGATQMNVLFNTSSAFADISKFFNINLDEDKEEVTLTRSEEDATSRYFIINI